jgi:hypothetical protein
VSYREASLHYLFQYGEWPADNEMTRQLIPVERETRTRLVLVDRIKDYNIQVSEKDVADWIATVFQDRETKQFHKEFYDKFISQLGSRGLKASDFERYARHQVAITHLAALAGAAGKLVTPQEANLEFRQAHEKADARLVLFNASNYLASVNMDPKLVARYYTNNAANYRLPDRVQVSYVAFPLSNYMAQAEAHLASITNLSEEINAEYLKQGPNSYTDASGQPMKAEDAKKKIREDRKKQSARMDARRAAIAFANDLLKIPVNTNAPNPAVNLETLAKQEKLEVKASEPFARGQDPKDMNVPSDFSSVAFQLTPEDPIITDPVVGEDTIYVVALKRRIPSELPSFESVKPQVVGDYKRSESLRLCREAGQKFATSVTNSIASGKSFDSAAQQAGMPVLRIAPFARDPRASIEGLPPQLDESSVRATAFDLAPGHLSGYVHSRDGGYVLYVDKFIPASDEEVKKELPSFVEEQRKRGASQAFNSWLTHQIQLAQLHINGDKSEQQD